MGPRAGKGTGDPVAVARGGVEQARGRSSTVVIVDTAGRLGIDVEMMAQARDIRDAVRPDETMYVVDAMIGQDAVTTANVPRRRRLRRCRSHQARRRCPRRRRPVGRDGHRAILFASTRRSSRTSTSSTPSGWPPRILDLGDMLTIIEQAEKVFDASQAEEMAAKLQKGQRFTLEDFLEQMRQSGRWARSRT